VKEDPKQQTLSITFDIMHVEQDNKLILSQVFTSFVDEQSYYILGSDNRFPEKLFEFNLSKEISRKTGFHYFVGHQHLNRISMINFGIFVISECCISVRKDNWLVS